MATPFLASVLTLIKVAAEGLAEQREQAAVDLLLEQISEGTPTGELKIDPQSFIGRYITYADAA